MLFRSSADFGHAVAAPETEAGRGIAFEQSPHEVRSVQVARRFAGDEVVLHGMSVLQQSTVSIGMMIVQAVVNPSGTQALAGYSATMRVENVFSLIFVSIGNAVSPYVSQNLGAQKIGRIKKGYHAALVLDLCFAVLAFIIIETLHTQISSLFLGKDGTAFA